MKHPLHRILVVAVAAGASSASQAADVAICIGVNNYPSLRSGSNLEGCVADARLMEKKLGAMGFSVRVLTNREATKTAILKEIRATQWTVGSKGRLVFYFAGHGSRATNGESVLLPSDALDVNEANDIQVDELYKAVGSVPALSKTIVLDSCHSGGMIRDSAGLRSFRNRTPRFYARSSQRKSLPKMKGVVRGWQYDSVNAVDDIVPTLGQVSQANPAVTYWTACLRNQVAAETTFGGEKHGVFTFHFAQALSTAGSDWKGVAMATTAGVLGSTDNEQKPVFHPASAYPLPVFGGGTATAAKPTGNGLGEAFLLSRPDPSKVRLTMIPEKGPIRVGDPVRLRVAAGSAGYLVILNRDPKGTLSVLWPQVSEGTLRATRVSAGQTIEIPEVKDRVLRADTPGTDHLKAILFNDEADARRFLQPLENGTRTVREALKQWGGTVRQWAETDADVARYTTSESITLIIPSDTAKAGL